MEREKNNRADVVIVGGGAAGFFAGIHCAEAAPGLSVVILEQGRRVLSKVLVSGGGRCNVTHACFDPAELVKRYPRGGRELRGPFHRWQPRDTVEWFEQRGVPLKTEADGRMFPVTDRADTIADCLLESARRAGVQVRTGVGIRSLTKRDDGFELESGEGGSWHAGRVMLATGGLKPGGIMESLRRLGHELIEPVPSLFTFHVEDPRLKGLAGLSVEEVEVSAGETRLQERGPLLVTHWGLSGPAILKLSAWGARELRDREYRFTCRVNWLPEMPDVEAGLKRMKQTDGRKQVSASPIEGLPRRLWERLTTAAGIPEGQTWSQLPGDRIRSVAEQLTACAFHVAGKSMNKEEFVTCGGVPLREVDFKVMESRKSKGLHFGGELLDIDAVTGGFNFQAAWTTGRIAGLAMSGAAQ